MSAFEAGQDGSRLFGRRLRDDYLGPRRKVDERHRPCHDARLRRARRACTVRSGHQGRGGITSANQAFNAGADLGWIESLTIHDPAVPRDERIAQLLGERKRLQELTRRIETGGKPFAAAINGTALGGGFELCLACHRRVVANGPGIQLGLPESKVGLLPAAGGTVRLVRMMGAMAALPLLLDGSPLGPEEAREAGLGNEVVPGDEFIPTAKRWIRSAGPTDVVKPWDRRASFRRVPTPQRTGRPGLVGRQCPAPGTRLRQLPRTRGHTVRRERRLARADRRSIEDRAARFRSLRACADPVLLAVGGLEGAVVAGRRSRRRSSMSTRLFFRQFANVREKGPRSEERGPVREKTPSRAHGGVRLPAPPRRRGRLTPSSRQRPGSSGRRDVRSAPRGGAGLARGLACHVRPGPSRTATSRG